MYSRIQNSLGRKGNIQYVQLLEKMPCVAGGAMEEARLREGSGNAKPVHGIVSERPIDWSSFHHD